MWAKIVILLGSISFILFGFFYFSTNSSYSLASESKSLYEIGKFDEAIKLAKIAYDKDHYNRMAFTVLTQAKESKKWLKYIRESSDYLERTKDISNQNIISKADRYEIKIMAELVMQGYQNLGRRNPMIDDDIKEEAKYIYMQFRKIYIELTNS